MVFVHGTIFETSNISILKKNRINATEPPKIVTAFFMIFLKLMELIYVVPYPYPYPYP